MQTIKGTGKPMSKERANTCGNCRWWERDGGRELRYGSCFRYPPNTRKLDVKPSESLAWLYPLTTYAYWCGEWTMTEEAEGESDDK